MTLPLPRYVITKLLATNRVAFYFNVPKRYRDLGCTAPNGPLGADYTVACGDDGNGGRAFALNALFDEWDAERRFNVPGLRVTDPKAAQCGEVLKGVLKPQQCKVFGTACTPETPVGALMVSSEGACAAYYRYAAKAA